MGVGSGSTSERRLLNEGVSTCACVIVRGLNRQEFNEGVKVKLYTWEHLEAVYSMYMWM